MQWPSVYQERSGTMTREKRGLEPISGDGMAQEPKRQKVPGLASVIVEALKVDSLQKLCSSLEPVLRRVVSEEVERAIAKLGPARLNGRSSPKRIEGPGGRNLQLHFKSNLSLPLFTGGKVEGEQGAAIHVVLVDADTGLAITTGPESLVKLDVVVLEGDFNREEDEDWTEEDFENHIVKEREGKGPLLTGDLQVSLKGGVGTLGDLTFTDNSSWIRSRKFRLGLKLSPGSCEAVRIREARTDAFAVKDHRGELYKKHYPPALQDEVWRLEKVGKDGSFHKRLNRNNILTVEDFLRYVVRDPQKLRNILGSGMSNKMWESLVEHAKTCVLSGKLYVYYSDDTRTVGATFNNIYEFCGLIAGGQYYSADSLSDTQKVFADGLMKKVYDNWVDVVEYDGKALLSAEHNSRGSSFQAALPPPADYSAYDQQAPLPGFQVLASAGHAPLEGGLAVGGTASSTYSVGRMGRYPSHLRQPLSGPAIDPAADRVHLPPTTYTGAGLGPDLGSFDDWSSSHLFSEEEIRMRSHEMLENEDMQHLLRTFTMGGGASVNSLDDYGYACPPYRPSLTPGFDLGEGQSRPPGKAMVGWLKIKAAMRWGIFIRKKAAERRAQLVDLDD
ncbi:unnamed protein product [Spirodela intermedia]|uniref:Uncharacterized protein n=2 Tax=Spirodela intermedia TaxID=51605 RepID=A0A7I8JPY1_SPIIN|nr:unnamed protein product [Spirodela intermedia]CAA6672206.1 unnamed protein product [Spirodela intermedia]CAA7409366.1 unnamed protein product [Spirodela intermedia]